MTDVQNCTELDERTKYIQINKVKDGYKHGTANERNEPNKHTDKTFFSFNYNLMDLSFHQRTTAGIILPKRLIAYRQL